VNFTQTVQDALNKQINAEMQAYYTYLSMSAWFEAQNLAGFAAWMRNHSDEEMIHAMKIFDYVNERGGRVVLLPIDAPEAEWDSIEQAIADALKHEEHVTKLIYELTDIADDADDYATENFLQWFVNEQVEEEKVVGDMLADVQRVGDFAPGIFLLDRELMGSTGTTTSESEA
jgi:ferritin